MLRGVFHTCATSIATLRFLEWATVSWQGPAGDRSGCSISYGRGSKTGLRQEKHPSKSQICREICKTASCAHTRRRQSLTSAAQPQRTHDVGRAVGCLTLPIDENRSVMQKFVG